METKRTIYLISGAACLFLAAGLILYPILGNALAEKNKSLVMTEYSRAVEEMTDTRVAEILAAAEVLFVTFTLKLALSTYLFRLMLLVKLLFESDFSTPLSRV